MTGAVALLALGVATGAAPEPAKADGSSAAIEPTLMSWAAMSEVATSIARAVDRSLGASRPDVVILTDEAPLGDLPAYRAVLEQLASLTQSYAHLPGCPKCPKVRGADLPTALAAMAAELDAVTNLLTGAQGLFGAVGGLIQTMQPSITVTGTTVTTDAVALANMVAGRVETASSIRLLTLSPAGSSGKLASALQALGKARGAVAHPALVSAEGQAIEARLKTILDALTAAPPAGSGKSFAARLSAAETVDATAASTLFLVVKPVVMGGTNLERNGLFIPPSVSHAGGAAATFTLTDKTGAVRAADTFWSYSGYARNPTRHKAEAGDFKYTGPAADPGQGRARR